MKPIIQAQLELLKPEEGGRKTPIRQGYCPHVRVNGGGDWLGIRVINHPGWMHPGDTDILDLELMYHPEVDYQRLQPGTSFTMQEGPQVIGRGHVIEVINHEPQTT